MSGKEEKEAERERDRDREMSGKEEEEEKKVVCVTGGSGYIASWLVKLLLSRGYTVRASVRDLSKTQKIQTQSVPIISLISLLLHFFFKIIYYICTISISPFISVPLSECMRS